ncbi:AraC family transcriptional regulator [Streptomyces sp. NPDC091377]|uniref:AraC family transcriptional regulator n=1 Tax=Streptomyces sp. NPDC091377 TaxID=3365995 RepID=UPI0038203C77
MQVIRGADRTTAGPPLARYEIIATDDVEEARLAGSSVFRDHQLVPESATSPFRARLHSVTGKGMSLTYVDYGSSVRIVTSRPSTGFLVHIPLAGRSEIVSAREAIDANPVKAAVLHPTDRVDMKWEKTTPHLIICLDRESMEGHLRRTLGRTLDRPLRFHLGMELTSPAARSWLNVIDLLVNEFSTYEAVPLAIEELEGLVFQRFLLAQSNTYSEILMKDSPIAPKSIQRAMAIIEAHAAEPLTVADIAEAVGTGVRALQDGFRRYADTTPMTYLREVRLLRVHADLLESDPSNISVTEIATRWGFLHPGRFAIQYRERFGEKPSVTLRR